MSTSDIKRCAAAAAAGEAGEAGEAAAGAGRKKWSVTSFDVPFAYIIRGNNKKSIAHSRINKNKYLEWSNVRGLLLTLSRLHLADCLNTDLQQDGVHSPLSACLFRIWNGS